MKLSEFIEKLQGIVEKNPDAANYHVVRLINDSGESAKPIRSYPITGNLLGTNFLPREDFDNYQLEMDPSYRPEENSVCIDY